MAKRAVLNLSLGVLLVASGLISVLAQSGAGQDDPVDPRAQSAEYARQLSSFDPMERQTGAEGLARLAAVDQKKLVSGYALQEKNKKVKLALNWALYRMGKSEALFEVVRDLDTARRDQATDYLTHLESPQPLYLFLPQDTTSSKAKERLLEVLGKIGDAETLDQIKPFTDSFDPKLSQAAQFATNQIQHRLDLPATDQKARPRVVGRP
jgi:HEAT repeat protein